MVPVLTPECLVEQRGRWSEARRDQLRRYCYNHRVMAYDEATE